MKEMAERFTIEKERKSENEAQKQYLLDLIKVQKGVEPPIQEKQEVNFKLQNPFEGKFSGIKKQNYTIKMTDNEQRELNRYQQYYNANKIAYMMAENQKLPESQDAKLLRYDHNTR